MPAGSSERSEDGPVHLFLERRRGDGRGGNRGTVMRVYSRQAGRPPKADLVSNPRTPLVTAANDNR